MESTQAFTVLDYIIFFGTVALSLGIGVFFACRKTKTSATIADYFLAGRKMSVTPAAMSLVVTFQSSLMVIGNPAEVYSYGLKYAYFLIGACLAFAFAAYTLVPLFHPLGLTSVYKYFHLRYQDNVVRYTIFVFGLLYYLIYMAVVTYGTCVALEVIIGIPQWVTILIYTIVTAIYTSIGGMKAVIWTDVLQLIIMMTGAIAMQTKCILEVGGVSKIVETASSRLDMAVFSFDTRERYQFWNTVIGSFFIFLANTFQQPGVQRINSIPDVRAAIRLYALAGPLYALFALIICTQGISIYSFYASRRCDPLESGRISTPNGIVPLVVADLFSSVPGLPGLFIAGLSSAALSTLSSSLSSLGAVTYEDIIKVNFPNLPEHKATLISKITVFLYGLVAMGFTFIVSVVPGSIIAISISFMGCFDGPICGIFLVSMFYRRATSKGVAAGSIIGVFFILWMNLGNMFTETVGTPPLPPAPVDGCRAAFGNISQDILSVNVLDRHVNDSHFSSDSSYIDTVSHFPHATYANDSQSFPNTTSIFDNAMGLPSNELPDGPGIPLSTLQNFYSISFIIYPFIGCAVTIILAVLFSFLSTPPKPVDDTYLFSFKRDIKGTLFGDNKGCDDEVVVETQPLHEEENN